MLANIGVNKLTSMNGFQVSAVKREANKVLALQADCLLPLPFNMSVDVLP